MRLFLACAAGLVVGLAGAPAEAFIKDCHSAITTEALRGVAWPGGRTPPPLSGDYVFLVDEVAVNIEPEAQNLWALALLLGNQYNDQGPHRRDDISSLADLAARPENQRQHCLRRSEDDGEEGVAQALGACRAYILEEIATALGEEEDEPDLDVTETVRLSLNFRGRADIPLGRYGFHLGHAVHALQDSFTHTFRTPDGRRVRTVLNWVDWLKPDGYDEARDGFQHLVALDSCGSSDEGGPERKDAAKQATAELLTALGDDTGGRAGRLERAAAVVDAWFEIEGGCTAANGWCGAPETSQVAFTGCAFGPGRRAGTAAGLGILVAAALLLRRRRVAPIAAIVVVVLASGAARAQTAPTASEDPAKGEVKGDVIPKASPAEQQLLTSRPIGILIKTGIAIDKGAGEFGLGFRYDIDRSWTVGIGAQWSPWYSIDGWRTKSGTADAFAVGVFRLNVRDYLEVRVTLAIGVSMLLFDTWAAEAGTFGPYFELSPLGAAIRMNARLRLLIEPAELVIPIPQTRGIPLVYRHHRMSVALQANF